MFHKKFKILAGVIVLLGAVGLGLHTNVIKLPIKRTMGSVTYIENFADDRELLGASHNIFVGRVIRQTGTKARGYIGPETQFEVEVVYNIKGNLQGKVTVNQEGGYINGILYTGEDSAGLLEPGTTYLLSTRYSPRYDWSRYLLISHPNASKVISKDASISSEQLRVIATNDEKVKALEAAYPHEILSKTDVAANRTWNSYASRHYDSNGQLIDDTVMLSQQEAASVSTEPSASAAAADAPAVSPGPSDTPVSSPDASVFPSDAASALPADSIAPAGDMASPTPSDTPLAS
ncbi:MAG: hypothetical protein WB755_14670 [Terriglobales bacterium]|jgi:hypothetical protein